MPFRVAIVNDLAMAREALRRVVLQIPDTAVAWMANDGAEALAKAKADRPDLVLMDLIMPVMDGVQSTQAIMRDAPCPIVVVTATVEGNASRVYEAIGAGALDAVDTPRLGSGGAQGDRALVAKVQSVRRMRDEDRLPAASAPRNGSTASPAAAAPTTAAPGGAPCPIVAVGASTGGPQALAALLGGLPPAAPYAVLVVQHMDAPFLPGLAQWLTAQTGREVRLARRGERPVPGSVLLAGEPLQMVVTPDGTVDFRDGDPDAVHRPSVDALFASLAAARGTCGTAVLLTGMGKDGAAGMLQLRGAGWRTIAQDQATSVVWGMPGAAVALGAAERTLPMSAIAGAVTECMAARPAGGAR
jgi:two-component system response regulator WspF